MAEAQPLAFGIESRSAGAESHALTLSGRLDLAASADLRRELAERLDTPGSVQVDLARVESLDGAAAAVLAEAWNRARCSGYAFRFDGARPPVQALIDLYTERMPRDCTRPAPQSISLFEHVGQASLGLFATLRQVLAFLGECLRAAGRTLREPRSVPWREVGRLLERHGADSLPIVLLIGFLIGLITAFQAAVQLHELGADSFVADLVALSITRELGPLMTAIVVAGRSGAAIAAELGTMRVSEEIDALHTMGLDPWRHLVFPRVLAVTLALPLLILLADVVGLVGGLLIGTLQLDLSVYGYLLSTQEALDLSDVFGGMLKGLFFGGMIALVACERGLAASGGAEGVGRSTTSAVVAILFHLIALDALFTVLFNLFGL